MKNWRLPAAGWLIAMFLLSRSGPIGKAPWLYALLYLAGFAGMFWLIRSWPRQWSFRRSVAVILALAIAGRWFFWTFPVGNDVYRYICEGYVHLQGLNPYRLPPESLALAHLAAGPLKDIWQQVNPTDLSAAYPPLTLLFFRLLASLSPTPAMFKGGMLFFDLVLMAALV
nr:hypothetical protein [Desulfobacterales bacterium]